MRVLSISPDPEFGGQIAGILWEIKAEVYAAEDSQQGLRILKEALADAVILDAGLKDLQLGRLIRKIQEKSPLSDILVATDRTSGLSSNELLAYGADKIVELPLDPGEVAFKVRNLWQAKQNLKACELAGKSQELKRISEQVLQIAPTDITVLITGESGTGKRDAARAIKNNTQNRGKPYLAAICAALAEGVL